MTVIKSNSIASSRRRSPLAAAILSFIPGLGQVWCMCPVRGVIWFLWIAMQTGVLLSTDISRPMVWWTVPLYLWNILDAWSLAEGKPRSLLLPILMSIFTNIVAAWSVTQADLFTLVTRFGNTRHIISGLMRPLIWENHSVSPTLILNYKLIIETIYMALIGTLLPIPITFILSVLGARNLMATSFATRSIYGAARSAMNLLRSVEVIVVALMLIAVVGPGPWAGVLAIAIHGVGAQGKLYSEAIEDIDPGPVEAIGATGATWVQRVMYGVMPQVTPQFIAFTMYRWDINVRMATVIGLVGGGGIGFTLKQYIDMLDYRQAATAIWLIAIAVILMDWASATVRKKFA